MSDHISGLVARVEAEPRSLNVNRFLDWLHYRDCKEDNRMLRDEAFIINQKSGATSSVPLRFADIDREMMYWICRELGVNMPVEFPAYQEMMDNLPLKPDSSSEAVETV